MSVSFQINMATGNGETFTIDVSGHNRVTGEQEYSIEQMEEMYKKLLPIADIRLYEMNMRMLNAYRFEDHFAPEIWSKVLHILEVLCGRMTPDQVLKLWQSGIEETQDLEAQRQAYHEKQLEQQQLAEQGIYKMQCGCVVENGMVELCEVHANDPFKS